MPLASGSVLPLAVATRVSVVTAGSGLMPTAGAEGRALTEKSTMAVPKRPSLSVAVRVRVCAPADRSSRLNWASPELSAPWVERVPSRSETQARESAVGLSSWSETVAENTMLSPSL